MTSRWALAFGALLLACLGGCGDSPTVDARGTDEETRASIERVKDALPENQRSDFEDALQALTFADFNDLSDLADSDGMVRRMHDRIHGKTGPEIIEEGLRIKAERDAEAAASAAATRERTAQVEAEIEAREAERERQRVERTTARVDELAARLDGLSDPLLEQFVIESAFLERGTGGMMNPDCISLRFNNGTDQTVTAAWLRFVFHTPGRELPWTDSIVYTTFEGGLGPGESTYESFRGGSYSEWSRLPRDRDDFVFHVQVTELVGVEDEPIAGQRFTKEDREKLDELLDGIDHDAEQAIRDRLRGLDEAEASLIAEGMKMAALRERASLLELKAAHDTAQAQRDGLLVSEPRFFWSEQMFSDEAVFAFTVTNNTSETVSRFKLDCVVSSPGRELPWAEGGLNYSPDGGLEPGESRDLELSPRGLSRKWSSVPKDRDDLVLSARVNTVENASGEEMFPSEWTDAQAARLDTIDGIIKAREWD